MGNTKSETNTDASEQNASKPDQAKAKPEQREKVDATTAAKNRSAFFKKS